MSCILLYPMVKIFIYKFSLSTHVIDNNTFTEFKVIVSEIKFNQVIENDLEVTYAH